MRATVAIPSLNEGRNLWRTAASCAETIAGHEDDIEILIADDDSNDDSLEQLREKLGHLPNLRVVAHETRRGVSATKDLCGREARGDIVLFLDGHCKPEPGAILRLIERIEERDGRIVLMPRVPCLDEETWKNNESQCGYGYRIELDDFAAGWVGRETLEQDGDLLISQGLIGCCVAMSKALYEELHGFDTDMRVWGVEDIDFGLRAWLAGAPIYTDPEASIGHRFRAKFDNYEVSGVHHLTNQIRMARKSFTDPVWNEWLENCRARAAEHEGFFDRAWKEFEARRESVESEREFCLSTRQHDEFWCAERFGMEWPVRR